MTFRTVSSVPPRVLFMHVRRRRQWQPTPVLLPGKSHGWRSLAGCSPWGRKESDTTEWLHFHFSLSWIGEGNGNQLQYSYLKSPRDGGAWCAAVYRVAWSWTRLKRLSSSNSMHVRGSKFKLYCVCAQLLSRVQLYVTPWTEAHQAALSMEFSRQEYWSGLPFPSPGDLSNPGLESVCPKLADRFFTTVPQRFIDFTVNLFLL